jgi:hypothetical protein
MGRQGYATAGKFSDSARISKAACTFSCFSLPDVSAGQSRTVSLSYKMLGEQKMNPITVDGGKGTVELGDEGVLHLVWKRGTVLEAADVHAAMAMVNELADGAEYPMLIDISNIQAVTRQARSVFSVKCAASRIALLGSSPVNRIIANFAMARRTLPCPIQLFHLPQ